jgi:hypothetical protein
MQVKLYTHVPHFPRDTAHVVDLDYEGSGNAIDDIIDNVIAMSRLDKLTRVIEITIQPEED